MSSAPKSNGDLMNSEKSYEILRNLSSPLVSITTSHAGRKNGMIANSAVRASLLPECPRISFYCFKYHYSHELIEESRKFCLHLLHTDQCNVVEELGFDSGRERDKLENVSHSINDRDMPVIEESYAYYDCNVINSMDTGPSTVFLGEAVQSGCHDRHDDMTLLDSAYFRKQASPDLLEQYRENKNFAQEWAREHNEIINSI